MLAHMKLVLELDIHIHTLFNQMELDIHIHTLFNQMG